jgi:hypothetical protein
VDVIGLTPTEKVASSKYRQTHQANENDGDENALRH